MNYVTVTEPQIFSYISLSQVEASFRGFRKIHPQMTSILLKHSLFVLGQLFKELLKLLATKGSTLTCCAYSSEVGPTGTTMTCRGDSQNGLASMTKKYQMSILHFRSYPQKCCPIFFFFISSKYLFKLRMLYKVTFIIANSYQIENKLIPVKWHRQNFDLLFTFWFHDFKQNSKFSHNFHFYFLYNFIVLGGQSLCLKVRIHSSLIIRSINEERALELIQDEVEQLTNEKIPWHT